MEWLIMNAKDRFINILTEQKGLTIEDATKVYDIYIDYKILKISVYGDIRLSHGAFLDLDVIYRALAEANNQQPA